MSSPVRSSQSRAVAGSSGVGLVVRAAALAVLWAALMRPFALTPVRGVVVLPLDGFRLPVAERLASGGLLPVLATLISQGVSGQLLAGAGAGPGDLFVDCRRETTLSEKRVMLWQELSAQGRRVALLHLRGGAGGELAEELVIPGGDGGELAEELVIPGPDEAEGFIGDDAGRVVSIRRIEEEGPPWPYSEMTEDNLSAVEGLRVGAWSDWLTLVEHVPQGRRGLFRALRIDEDRLYLTPVYRRFWKARELLGELGDGFYVADSPSLPPAESDGAVSEAMRQHLRDLMRSRARFAVAAAAREPSLLVYSEDMLRRSAQLEGAAGESPTEAVLVDDYRALDQVLGRLIEAAGDAVAFVLVGRGSEPPASVRAGSPENPVGSYVIGGLGAVPLRRDVTIAVLASTLRRLLGVGTDAGGACAPPLPLAVASVVTASTQGARGELEPPDLQMHPVEEELLRTLR